MSSIPSSSSCGSLQPQASKKITGRRLLLTQPPSSSSTSSRHPVVLPLVFSSRPLSFWGGICPTTSKIIDHTSPIHDETCAGGRALAIPSSRGSCTGSQVLLELIINEKCPDVIITTGKGLDEVLAAGIIVAEEVLKVKNSNLPLLVCVEEEDYYERLSDAGFISIILDDDDVVSVYYGRDSTLLSSSLTTTTTTTSAAVVPSIAHPPFLSQKQQSPATEAQLISYRILHRLSSLSSSSTAAAAEPTPFIPITRAHIDACTYIGQGGVLFIQKMLSLGGRTSVPTTLNSISVDLKRTSQPQTTALFSPRIAIPSSQLAHYYLTLGAQDTFTCAPYLEQQQMTISSKNNDSQSSSSSLSPPQHGDIIAWGESNAIVYANSLLGARTDKYPDYVDVCAAILGYVPQKGLYVDEGRRWGMVIDVSLVRPGTDENGDVDDFFPCLGYAVGKIAGEVIPLIVGWDDNDNDDNGGAIVGSKDDWKAFSAAFGTSAAAPMFHVWNMTPEAAKNKGKNEDVVPKSDVILTWDDLRQAYRDLNSSPPSNDVVDDDGTTTAYDRIDLVALGNPHLSLTECRTLASHLTSSSSSSSSSSNSNNTIHPSVTAIATLSRNIYHQALHLGYISTLQKFGIQFINDTCWCMLTEPTIPPHAKTILTNSGKYAHYAPGLVGRRVRLGSVRMCVEAMRTGRMKREEPFWLRTKKRFVGGVGGGGGGEGGGEGAGRGKRMFSSMGVLSRWGVLSFLTRGRCR